jgi:hypothetical protein
VAAWVPDMFSNFYLLKNNKIAENSTTAKAREKTNTDLESLDFLNLCLTRFENNQVLLNKFRFLLTIKLFKVCLRSIYKSNFRAQFHIELSAFKE